MASLGLLLLVGGISFAFSGVNDGGLKTSVMDGTATDGSLMEHDCGNGYWDEMGQNCKLETEGTYDGGGDYDGENFDDHKYDGNYDQFEPKFDKGPMDNYDPNFGTHDDKFDPKFDDGRMDNYDPNFDNRVDPDFDDNYDLNNNNFDTRDDNFKPEYNDGRKDNYNENFNDQGQDSHNCFGTGNEECRERSLKYSYRDIERMKKEIQQITRGQKGNSGDLGSFIQELDALKVRFDNASSQDEVDTIREDVQEIQQSVERFRMQGEIDRMEREMQQEQKRFEKDRGYLNDMKKTLSGEWKEMIIAQMDRMDKMMKLREQMLESLKSGEDWMAVDDIRWEMDDLRWEMDDFWGEFEEIKTQQWAGQMFDDVERTIEKFLTTKYPLLEGEMKEKADKLVEIAGDLIERGRQAQADGDDEALKEIQFRLDELGMKAEGLFGKPKPEFEKMGFSDDFDDEFQDFSGDMNYEEQMKIVKHILTVNPDIVQKILLSDPLLAEKTFKIFDRVPTEMQGAYLEGKNSLSEVYTEIEKSNSQIRAYKNDILGYNYFGSAQEEVTGYLEEVRDGTMTPSTLAAKLDALKDSSRKAKFSAGVTSFVDYDDSDWYYEDVEKMKEGGFINGKKGDGGVSKFAGGDNITYAEALKITLEKFGKGQSSNAPAYSGAQGHWASGYYAKAEEMGITLLPADHYVSRGEFAKLVVEATLGNPTSHSSSSFSDLNSSDPSFNYLETLRDYDVINGDAVTSGLPTVRSGHNLNRAEAAKVINKAFDNMKFDMLEVEDLDYLLE